MILPGRNFYCTAETIIRVMVVWPITSPPISFPVGWADLSIRIFRKAESFLNRTTCPSRSSRKTNRPDRTFSKDRFIVRQLVRYCLVKKYFNVESQNYEKVSEISHWSLIREPRISKSLISLWSVCVCVCWGWGHENNWCHFIGDSRSSCSILPAKSW